MSAIRALRQLSSTSARIAASRTIARQAALSLPRSIPASAVRAFSVSTRVQGTGSSDALLAQKLKEELTYETENADAALPEFVKEFEAQGVWKIENTVGQEEVALTRSFGNETIRVLFSIADLQTDPEENFEDEEEADDANEDEEEVLRTYPIRTAMTITKGPGSGSLSVDMVCQEGNFVIENISYYKDAKMGTDLTAEADWARRGLYMGPAFDSLDASLQDRFEEFLQERGINETVALFIPEYAEFKEQTEYTHWLKNVKGFVEA